jgi:hypothetical protein
VGDDVAYIRDRLESPLHLEGADARIDHLFDDLGAVEIFQREEMLALAKLLSLSINEIISHPAVLSALSSIGTAL